MCWLNYLREFGNLEDSYPFRFAYLDGITKIDMAELSDDEIRDKILAYLSQPNMLSRPIFRPENIIKEMGLDIQKEIAHMLCNKMARDGYLKKSTHAGYFSLMYEGTELIKNGGYVGLSNKKSENENVSRMEMEKLELEVDALRKDFFDYEKTKSRTKRSEVYAILAIIISVIATVLQMICNKHN